MATFSPVISSSMPFPPLSVSYKGVTSTTYAVPGSRPISVV